VRQHDGIVVGVDDPAVGRGGLRHLVGVAGGRDPGAYSPCGGLGAGKVSSYAGWPWDRSACDIRRQSSLPVV